MKPTPVFPLLLALFVFALPSAGHAGARPPRTDYYDPARAIADFFVGGPYLNAPTDFQIRTIKRAQDNLRTLGYYRGPTSGQPDARLTQALVAYQRDNGFKTTGRLDKVTLQALDLLYLQAY